MRYTYLWYWAWRKLNSSFILSQDSPTVNLKGWPGCGGPWNKKRRCISSNSVNQRKILNYLLTNCSTEPRFPVNFFSNFVIYNLCNDICRVLKLNYQQVMKIAPKQCVPWSMTNGHHDNVVERNWKTKQWPNNSLKYTFEVSDSNVDLWENVRQAEPKK